MNLQNFLQNLIPWFFIGGASNTKTLEEIAESIARRNELKEAAERPHQSLDYKTPAEVYFNDKEQTI